MAKLRGTKDGTPFTGVIGRTVEEILHQPG